MTKSLFQTVVPIYRRATRAFSRSTFVQKFNQIAQNNSAPTMTHFENCEMADDLIVSVRDGPRRTKCFDQSPLWKVCKHNNLFLNHPLSMMPKSYWLTITHEIASCWIYPNFDDFFQDDYFVLAPWCCIIEIMPPPPQKNLRTKQEANQAYKTDIANIRARQHDWEVDPFSQCKFQRKGHSCKKNSTHNCGFCKQHCACNLHKPRRRPRISKLQNKSTNTTKGEDPLWDKWADQGTGSDPHWDAWIAGEGKSGRAQAGEGFFLNGPSISRKSRKLAYLLRHDQHFPSDSNGYSCVQLVCKHLSLTQAELSNIVRQDDKSRFSFNAEGTAIRASQGHSKKVQILMQPFIDDYAFHWTYKKCVENIFKYGLSRQTRLFVHMVDDPYSALRRLGCDTCIKVDLFKLRGLGGEVYLSDNGVVLSSGVFGAIPPECLSIYSGEDEIDSTI